MTTNGDDEREIQQRLEESRNALARFHEAIRDDPGLWRDEAVVWSAWHAAEQWGHAENALLRSYRFAAERERVAAARGGAAVADTEPPDPIRLHQLRAIHGEGELVNAMGYLRQLTDGEATWYPDLERRILHGHLLDVLATVQPEVARLLRLNWTEQQARVSRKYLDIWEPRRTRSLVRLLEPLLEDTPNPVTSS